jgi:hypothetical protein
MKTIKQFKNPQDHVFASIFCEQDQGMLMDVWSIQHKGACDLKSVFDYCFEKFEENGIYFWLCDETKLETYLAQEGMAAKQMMKNIIQKSELQKVSLVCRNPENVQAHESMAFIASCGVQVNVFKNNVLAMRWLTDNQSELSSPYMAAV